MADFTFIDRMSEDSNSETYNYAWMDGYTPRPSDVYICTYAKSGTHWAMQAAQQIAYYGCVEYDHIHDLVPWVENNFMSPIPSLSDRTIADRAPTGLRIIKTHLQRRYLKFNPASTYIVIVRDPKEIIVSYYYFVNVLWQARVGVSYPLELYVKRFVSPCFIEAPWAEHVAGWWQVRDRPNVLLLTYNELKADPRLCYRQMAAVMGVTLTARQMEQVACHSDFNYMRQHPKKFDLLEKTNANGSVAVLRSGRVGNSAELLTPAQQCAIDTWHRGQLQRLNSDFPYDIFTV